jgi:hypothetical protein
MPWNVPFVLATVPKWFAVDPSNAVAAPISMSAPDASAKGTPVIEKALFVLVPVVGE